MQKYRRQIAYLYAYEHGEQLCTAGFVKTEERAGQCRIAVHLKGYCHPGEDAGELYIYFYRKNQAVCIPLGKLESRNGTVAWKRMIFLEKGSALMKPEESGSAVRVGKIMWRNGTTIR